MYLCSILAARLTHQRTENYQQNNRTIEQFSAQSQIPHIHDNFFKGEMTSSYIL